jgi:hypothetical protein
MKVNPRVITLADAAPDDAAAIAILLAELDAFYGDTPQGTPRRGHSANAPRRCAPRCSPTRP